MTLATLRGFHREIIVSRDILRELLEIVINVTTNDLAGELEEIPQGIIEHLVFFGEFLKEFIRGNH